ncbi:pyridoxal phosphate-dependent aminotransferase [Streptomyces sp. UNOC14_S4]|uniref:pyridoxal phosphate-dependent aminotransferase n=1 Tax=Streptomyces sp. UNOC14_S4 TaxID=2872340 RepID=UPI001E35AE2D|nr:pyridoxal phosphate-dependent aminotransferase [Streptomyces sp. UNOC14_S4]MCC3772866.1 pyridoxal phosphate-dependent aminotransferase [Streptomyces sp. UNOC14_S4]
MQLFTDAPARLMPPLPRDALASAAAARRAPDTGHTFTPAVDERTLDVFRRARDPADPRELRDLWLGRIEHEQGRHATRPQLAEHWRASAHRRDVTTEELLSSRTTVAFVHELHQGFPHEEAGDAGTPGPRLSLLPGPADACATHLPRTVRDCMRYALRRDWYGYSDSCGRVPAREALAAYENRRVHGARYTGRNVALTVNAPFAVSGLADHLLSGRPASGAPALCAVPNRPTTVQAVARRADIRLVPLTCADGTMSVAPLLAALRPDTPLVFLPTVACTTGARVAEDELALLIRAAPPSTVILLDESDEWLGGTAPLSAARAAPHVVRVSGFPHTWQPQVLDAAWIVADSALVADYYEYASTSFGGPPSLLYTTVEVVARMERWLAEGTDRVGPAETGEFETTYGLTRARLQHAYDRYRLERRSQETTLTTLRDAAVHRLSRTAGVRVHTPRCSVDLLVETARPYDSYRLCGELLRETGVAAHPPLLDFCLAGGGLRITTAKQWPRLTAALSRLRPFLEVP